VERLVLRELVKSNEALGVLDGVVDVEILLAGYRRLAIVALIVVDHGGLVVIHNLLHHFDFGSRKRVVLLLGTRASVVASSEANTVL
jgi:hypothetical protein